MNLFKRNKIKEYKFTTWEAACIGDKYEYKVKAKTRKEAFNKLVTYFFGKEYIPIEDIKSSGGTIMYPNLNREGCTGMPDWFHDTLKGRSSKKSQEKLQTYMINHNIKSK